MTRARKTVILLTSPESELRPLLDLAHNHPGKPMCALDMPGSKCPFLDSPPILNKEKVCIFHEIINCLNNLLLFKLAS